MKTIHIVYTLLTLLLVCPLQAMEHTSLKHLNTLLIQACIRGFKEEANSLINLGADINQCDAQRGFPLMCAAHFGHTELVKFLLLKKVDVNTTFKGLNALTYAIVGTTYLQKDKHIPSDRAEEIMLEIVEMLINAGINVRLYNEDNTTALHYATHYGTARIAQVLINAGAEVNIQTKQLKLTPLMEAVISGHVDTVKVLLKAGASLEAVTLSGKTALDIAHFEKHKDIADLLRQVSQQGMGHILGEREVQHLEKQCMTCKKEPCSLLCSICKNAYYCCRSCQVKHWAIHKAICKRQDSVHTSSCMPHSSDSTKNITEYKQQFFQAALDGNEQAIKTLFTKVNINAQDKKGRTALYLAVKNNHYSLVTFLFEAGASIEMGTNKCNVTPLMKALKEGYEKIALFLLEKGARINATDIYGTTMLHCAAKGGCQDVISLLIKMGLTSNATTIEGISALACATRSNSLGIISRLVAAGAHLTIEQIVEHAFTRNEQKLSNKVEKIFGDTTTGIQLKETIQKDFSQAKNHVFNTMHKDALEFIKMLSNYHIQTYLKDPHAHYNSLASTVYKECFNQTVLIWACALGHSEVVETVLGRAPSYEFVHAQDTYGRTALIYAIMCGYDTIVDALLSIVHYLPEHLNIQDKKGNTALMYATAQGNFSLSRRLIRTGALFAPGDIERVIQLATKPEVQKMLNSFLVLSQLHMLYNTKNTHRQPFSL